MAVLVGSAAIAIAPDLSGFMVGLQAKVKAALSSLDARLPVKFDIDTASLASARAALGVLAGGENVPLRFTVSAASVAAARAALGPLAAGKTVPLSFTIDAASVAAARAALGPLAAGKTVPLRFTVDAASAAKARAAMGPLAGETVPVRFQVDAASVAAARAAVGPLASGESVALQFTVDASSVAAARAALGPLAAGENVPLRFTVDAASAAKARAVVGPLAGGENIPLRFTVSAASVARARAALGVLAGGENIPLRFTVSAASVAAARSALGPLAAGKTVPLTFTIDPASVAAARAALGPLAAGRAVPISFTVDRASAAKARAEMGPLAGETVPIKFQVDAASVAAARSALGPLAGETVPVRFVVDSAGVTTITSAGESVAGGASTAAAATDRLNAALAAQPADALAAAAAQRTFAAGADQGTAAAGTSAAAITRLGRGFAALRAAPDVPLFGGAFGTTPIIGSISALNLLAHGFIELAAVVIPASIALGAFGVAALPTITAIKTQLTNMQTVVDATGQNLGPLTGGFTRLAAAVRPQVYSLFGDGLTIAARKTGVLTTLATGAGQVIANLGTRFTAAITSGNDFSRFVSGAIKALGSFGDIIGNIGGILGNVLKMVPGYANVLLSVVDDFTKVAETVSSALIPVGKVGLAFHGAALYIGLAGTAVAKLISGGLGLLGGWAEKAATAAASSRLLGAGGDLAAVGLTRLSIGATAAAALPWNWIAIVAAGIGFLAYKLLTAQDATQRWISTTQQAIATAPAFATLDVIMAAQATTAARLTEAQKTYAGVQGQVNKLVGMGGQALRGASAIYVQAHTPVAELSAASANLALQNQRVTTRVADLSKAYGGNRTALELLTLAGVNGADLVDRSSATWAKIQLEVAAVALAYKDMGQQQGLLGSDMNALTLAGSDQVTQMTSLNTAWDTWIKIVSGGQTSFITFEQALKQTGAGSLAAQIGSVATAAKGAHASMTGLSVSSLALRSAWQSAYTSGSQVLDALRLQSAIMPRNSQAAKDLASATKDIITQLAGEGKQSAATRAELVSLANEVDPNIKTWQELVKWLGNTKDAGHNLDQIMTRVGTAIQVLSTDVQALSATMQTDVTSAFSKARLEAASVYTDIDKLAGAMQGGNTASITKWSDTLYGAFRKAGLSVQTATGLIEAFTHTAFTPPGTSSVDKLTTAFGKLSDASRKLNTDMKATGASFTGTGFASDILQTAFQTKLVPSLQNVIKEALAAGPPTKALANVVATELSPAVKAGALNNDTMRLAIYKMAVEAGYHGKDNVQALTTWFDKNTTSAGNDKTAVQKLEAQIALLKSKIVDISVAAKGTWSVSPVNRAAQPGKTAGPLGGAAGMLVSGGVPGKDSVPIMAMPGEAVVPTHLVPAVAPILKAGKVPGFAAGGVVGSYNNGTVPGLSAWTTNEYNATVKALEVATAGATAAALKTALSAAVKAAQTFGGGLGNASLRTIENWWIGAGGPGGGTAHVAAAITGAESGFNPKAVQQGQPYATTGWGLWQITPGDSEPQAGINQALLTGPSNAIAAVAKYRQAGGFSPWTTFEDGAYLRFMDQGGWLPPGASQVMNMTGAPELVLNADQVRHASSGGQSMARVEGLLGQLASLFEANPTLTGRATADALNNVAKGSLQRGRYSAR